MKTSALITNSQLNAACLQDNLATTFAFLYTFLTLGLLHFIFFYNFFCKSRAR